MARDTTTPRSADGTGLTPPARPVRVISRVVSQFLETEAAGGAVLLVAAVVALLWANSPWHGSYEQVWHTELAVRVGRFELSEDLRHWVNDALMAVFFFVVGLEIKRELVHGELREPRVAALPAVAALGGMVVPAALFLAATAGSGAARGWGIPMATDIAFAVGVVAVLGARVPASLKLFLLSLAIVDDIGAIVVIALFYARDVQPQFLGVAAALLAVVILLQRARVVWMPAYVLLGFGLWFATLLSGVHATIAGVVLGLAAPASPFTPAAVAGDWARDLSDEPAPAELETMRRLAKGAISPAERLQHMLHPWTSFVIIPLFALANAGVRVSGDAFDAPGGVRVSAGVVLGLVAGKTLGITAASWLSVRSGLGRLPSGTTWPMLAGVAALGGIGFTVSLFITELAFAGGPLQDAAKIGVLAASTLAAALGSLVLIRVAPRVAQEG